MAGNHHQSLISSGSIRIFNVERVGESENILDGDSDGANDGNSCVLDQADRILFLVVIDHELSLEDRLLIDQGQIHVRQLLGHLLLGLLMLGHLLLGLLLQEFGCATGCYKKMNEDDEEENDVEKKMSKM